MRICRGSSALATILCILVVAHGQLKNADGMSEASATPSPRGSSPQSFYVTVQAVSDASPFWFNYVIDVSIHNGVARVTLIRVAPVNGCQNRITVSAKEATVPAKKVNRITNGLCSIRAQDVEHAIAKAKPDGLKSVFDSASYSIVERCGDREEVVRLPLPEEINEEKMHRNYPKIAKLWDLPASLFQAAFNGNPLASEHGNADANSQRDAEPFIEKLRSGAFDKGFSKSGSSATEQPWSSVLTDYHGVITAEPAFRGDALDKDALGLDHYVAANYPPLARQARVQGDVKLTLTINPQTGKVDELNVLEGPAMLRQAALEAVRLWQFKMPLSDAPPTTAIIRFDLRCPAP
jgi:TonB family protein